MAKTKTLTPGPVSVPSMPSVLRRTIVKRKARIAPRHALRVLEVLRRLVDLVAEWGIHHTVDVSLAVILRPVDHLTMSPAFRLTLRRHYLKQRPNVFTLGQPQTSHAMYAVSVGQETALLAMKSSRYWIVPMPASRCSSSRWLQTPAFIIGPFNGATAHSSSGTDLLSRLEASGGTLR